MRVARLFCFIATAFWLSGCCTVMFWRECEEDSETPPAQPVAANEASAPKAKAVGTSEEHELKLAKIWARVDELEEEQFRQKERLRVIEKGLTLGLVPEELKHQEAKHEPKKAAPSEVEEVQEKAKPKEEAKKTSETPPVGKEDNEKYQAAMAAAHDEFRAGRYGRAIVSYSDIAKQFGNQIGGGAYLYWIGKSWANLKEYSTARQHFLDFLKDHASSPWVPRAKLDLARVEWRLGFQETALKRLKEIVQEHPYEDAAEMAKMELQSLDKKL